MKFTSRRRSRRAGLTLIELIVVLAVLIALGGIAVAVAPDMLSKAHVAEAVTNIQSVDTAVQQRRLTQNGEIGDAFDSFVNGGAIVTYLPGVANYTPYALTPNDLPALAGIGLRNIVPAAAATAIQPTGAGNATFDSHDGPATAIATGTTLCALTPAAAAVALVKFNILTPTAGSQYVLLGLGERCSLVGANGVMAEAPVHFADTNDLRANTAYAHFVVLVELQNAGTATASARYLGAAAVHQDGLIRTSDELAEWYQ